MALTHVFLSFLKSGSILSIIALNTPSLVSYPFCLDLWRWPGPVVSFGINLCGFSFCLRLCDSFIVLGKSAMSSVLEHIGIMNKRSCSALPCSVPCFTGISTSGSD